MAPPYNLFNMPPPDFQAVSLCQPKVTFEITDYDPEITYRWDFLNEGKPVLHEEHRNDADNQAVYAYQLPGYYRVILVAEWNGCTAHSTQIINVIPHSFYPEYNHDSGPSAPCLCCSENITYDYPDGETIYGTVPIDNNRTYKNNLVIAPGAVVTIANCILEFGPQAGIIIEPGGRLSLDSSVTLSGLSECGDLMWQGIEVRGNTSYNHYDSFGNEDITGQSQQGLLEIKPLVCIIRNAHTGVFVGERYVCIPHIHYGHPMQLCKTGAGMQAPHNQLSFYRHNKGGGILDVCSDGKTILAECAVGIYYTPYPKINASKICYVEFSSDILKDPYYNPINGLPAHYNGQYPNPWYTRARKDKVSIGIYQYKTWLKNPIERISIDNHWIGSVSYDARYELTKSKLTNLHTGVWAMHAFPSNFNRVGFYNNTFDIIEDNAIRIEGELGTVIHDNTFGDSENELSNQSTNATAIRLLHSNAFTITDNTITRFTLGVHCDNSGQIGGIIREDTRKEGNIFTQCNRSINTLNDNRALRIRCNQFINDDITGTNPYSGLNWLHSGSGFLGQQGELDYSYEACLPAGNSFDPPDKKQIRNTAFFTTTIGTIGGFPFIITLPAAYNYFAHGTTNYPERRPVVDGSILLNTESSQYQPEHSCNCGNKSLEQLKADILVADSTLSNLYPEYVQLSNAIDDGNTQGLLDMIADTSITADSLLTILLAYSPLSDTCIIAAIKRKPDHLSYLQIRDIVVPNSPVSAYVFAVLSPILDVMPDEIRLSILNAQTNYTANRTLSGVQAEIDNFIVDKIHAQSELLRIYLDTGFVDSAAYILLADTSRIARQLLAGMYLATGDTTEAAQQLYLYEPADSSEAEWKNFAIVQFQRFADTLEYVHTDTAYADYLRSFAYRSQNVSTTIYARNLLRLLYNEDFEDIPLQSLSQALTQFPQQEALPHKEAARGNFVPYLGQNFPNPFTGKTVIPYKIGEQQKGMLEVFDKNGKLLRQIPVHASSYFVEIDMSGFGSGSFYYRLQTNDGNYAVKQMLKLQ